MIPIVGKIIESSLGAFSSYQERKQQEETLDAKIKLGKQNSESQIQLTDAEWELLSIRGSNGSWKDEYVTVVITCWIPLIFLACLHAAYTGNVWLLDGVSNGIKKISEAGINLGTLTEIVVFAAVGLKIWRGR